MTNPEVDEKVRYAIFRKRQGKCQHCGVRLKWDEYGVRGRSGGWALEVHEHDEDTAPEQRGLALCFRCLEFPNRSKSGKVVILSEP